MRRRITPRRSPLQTLLDAAADQLVAEGWARQAAGPWLRAARIEVVRSQGCGWEMDTTPAARVERDLVARGWTWLWEGDELTLALPGWQPPAPKVVALQPSLFD